MVAKMLLPRFEFEAPADLDTACELLAQAGAEARPLAGGTDLLVKMKLGDLTPRLVVSLARLAALRSAPAVEGDGIQLGALNTMSLLADAPQLDTPWTLALREGAAAVGGPIIRNRATVGGNIVNARPCADSVPPLIAMGARLRLQSAEGERWAELDGFVSAPGKTEILDKEILTAIMIPPPATGRGGSCYLKLTRRAVMEVTTVGCAASVELAEDDTIAAARIVLTSVAPVPLRVQAAEAHLVGSRGEASALRQAAQAARQGCSPIDDHRAPAWYRSDMVEELSLRALRTALARAAGRAS